MKEKIKDVYKIAAWLITLVVAYEIASRHVPCDWRGVTGMVGIILFLAGIVSWGIYIDSKYNE